MLSAPAPQKAETRNRNFTRDDFRRWMTTRHYSPRSIDNYVGWAIDFVRFHRRPPNECGSDDVNTWLSSIANERHVTAKTQEQALCAIVRLFECMGTPLGDIGKFAFASKPSRLPVVMSVSEVERVLSAMPPVCRLMAKLLYGCGLRLMECCRLRVKDIDWDRGTIHVRAGKGDKDRYVMLPLSVRAELVQHILHNRTRFDADGSWCVHLPDALSAKYPGYEREWRWQYVFAARGWSKDPTDGRLKVHHIHENTLQKAVKQAVDTAGITKRVTCHTFRHSFATHLIEAGRPVYDVQKLLGHSRIETTMVYVHVAAPPEKTIQSPLDSISSQSLNETPKLLNVPSPLEQLAA